MELRGTELKMRTRYKIYNDDTLHFITSTIVDWIPIFTNKKYYNILIDTIKYYQSNSKLEVIAYVFLPEHFHMILKSRELSKTIRLIKMYSAKEIIKQLKFDEQKQILKKLQLNKKEYKTKSNFQLWQEGFKPKEIIGSEMLRQKIDYIHFNPVKKRLVSEPTEWEYSSANFYKSGKSGVIDLNLEF